MQNTLGVSLKTKLLGMAVFYNGELTDYRVRTFYGAWTKDKRDEMTGAIKNVIKRYGISAVSLKTPAHAHCTQGIRDIISDIRRLTEQLCIKLLVCTVSALIEHYSGNGRGNRQALIQAIVSKYPNHRKLAQLHDKERSNRNAYHIKLFEAIACGELALKTLQ